MAAFSLLVTWFALSTRELVEPSYDRQAEVTWSHWDLIAEHEDQGSWTYRVQYKFSDSARTERHGESYTESGRYFDGLPDAVLVNYLGADPSVSCIPGMRRKPDSAFDLLLPLVLGIPGLWLALYMTRRGLRLAALVRHGLATRGRLVDWSTIDDDSTPPLMEMVCAYDAGDVTREVKARLKTSDPMEKGRSETVLFAPASPARAVVLSSLPGRPTLDSGGEILAEPIGLFWLLVWPTLCVVAAVATIVRLAAP